MAKLPGVLDLGAIPTPAVTGVDTGALAQGAAALQQGGEKLGAGVEQLGQSIGDVGIDRQRFDYAKAHADFLSRSLDINETAKQDNNYAADENGKTLAARTTDSLNEAQQQSAQLIDPGPMRDRFMLETKPIVTRYGADAAARARGLQNDADVAYVGAMGDTLISKAVAAPDDGTRAALIDSHNQLVDGLQSSGAITPVQALGVKQAWAKQYATADLMARADTDPQGVINELRAAPGSGDDITNRIVQNEGTAQNGKSSAVGVGQFTDATWLDVLKRNRPDLAQGRSDADLLALRADKGLARDMTDAYRQENVAYLQKQGLDPTPGAQYLAHFLGPGGAAAVLKADPNKPIADVLAGVVGKDKAADMIARNPSVLNGQLAGSVKQWADAKMGGQVPGGGSIYDILTPDVRETILTHAQAALDKQTVSDRADFKARVDNAVAEAYDTGTPSQPLTQADFVGVYGAGEGPQRFAQYDTEIQTGRTINAMNTMAPVDRQNIVDSLQPKPGDPNYALKEKAYEVAQKASGLIDRQLFGDATHKADPAAFAVRNLAATKDAYAAFSTALTTGTDADRAAAAQKLATTTMLDQARVGVGPDSRRVVPQAYADQLTARLQKVGASDDPQARVGLIGQVQREAAMWGPSYWPQVMRQLAPGSQPIVRAIAAGADPAAMTRLLSLDPKEKPADVLKQQDVTKATALNTSIDDAMAPFRSSLVGRQLDRDYPGYYNLASTLGALYVRDGMSADDAAKKAFGDLVGNRYDFRDTWRMPKSANISADDVQAGTVWARRELGSFNVKPAIDDMGLGDANAADSLSKFGRDGKFVTAPDNSGLNLAYGDKFVRTADGAPLKLSWAQLATLGKQQRAAATSATAEAPQL